MLLLNINVREEVIPHERVITLWMTFRKTDVFVHIERYDMLKRHLTSLISFDKSLVHAKRRRPCRKP